MSSSTIQLTIDDRLAWRVSLRILELHFSTNRAVDLPALTWLKDSTHCMRSRVGVCSMLHKLCR